MSVSHSLEERSTESPQLDLAQRVVASAQLRSSPKLCEFFLYVVDCSLRNAPEDATEQQIGIHVFHREPGYNSSDDSIVRSQARLLRLKLAAYFADEGAREDFIIEIPKGHYLPVFHPAKREIESQPTQISVPNAPSVAKDREPEQPDLPQRPSTAPAILRGNHPRPLWRYLAAAFMCIGLAVLFGFGWGRVSSSGRSSGDQVFWQPFLTGQPPLVIFSNPLFTGTPYLGMRLASSAPQSPASAAPEIIDDTYTGTGEASAIHDLTRLFDAHHAEFILKRSRLVTWDEARSRNLIFIGAPSQNGALQDLKTNSDFTIDLDDDRQGYVANRHPLPAEPAKFKPSSSSEEYAIIASFPGVASGTRIIMFTGLTTNGTQAAVEFMCNPDTAQRLTTAVGKSGNRMAPFEAVLHIKMSGGVPMQADIAAVHIHS